MSDHHHVCPWWVGYFLASPLRRWVYKPEAILGPYVEEDMSVLDIGCAMGFFSLPLARLVGSSGRVICVDLQEKMLNSLHKRAEKAGLSASIESRLCSQSSLDIDHLAGTIDFALTFALVHEVPEKKELFSQINRALKSDGKLLVAEPSGIVSKSNFDKSIVVAQDCGFEIAEQPGIKRTRATLLRLNR